jgi:pilus assembly protein Flp/PilA
LTKSSTINDVVAVVDCCLHPKLEYNAVTHKNGSLGVISFWQTSIKRWYMVQKKRQAEGQGLVEYALILVLVAVVVIGILTVLGPQVGNVFSRVVAGLTVGGSGGGGGAVNPATVTAVTALRGGADVVVSITVSANTNVTVVDSQSGQSRNTSCSSTCQVTMSSVGPAGGTVTATATGGSSMSTTYPAP